MMQMLREIQAQGIEDLHRDHQRSPAARVWIQAHPTCQPRMTAFSPQLLPVVTQGWKHTHPLPERQRNAPFCLEVLLICSSSQE
ncbi:uncharacterized protein LOC144282485 isoform X6 [Canis aureus]